MRVAAIYDIHGNLPALEAAIDDIRQADVDFVVVGGDVLPGPMPLETISLLLSIGVPTQFILGNGDREVLAQMSGTETDWFRTAAESWRDPVRWTARQLNENHARLIAGWPATFHLMIPQLGEVLFCHATPTSDTDVFTRLTCDDRLLPIFNSCRSKTVVCGHTHMQFDRVVGDTRVLNSGSVGMPYGEPGAYWLLLGNQIELRRTDYDLEKAAERIRLTGYPQAESFATNHILSPPAESEILQLFSKIEI